MVLLFTSYVLGTQTSFLKQSYDVQTSGRNFIQNPYSILYSITTKDYNELLLKVSVDPDKFTDNKYLDKINKSFLNHDSFIIVKKNGYTSYIGNHTLYKSIDTLPSYDCYESNSKDNIYIDSSVPCVIREKSFYYSGGAKGQIFLITDLTKLMPRWYSTLQKLFVAFILAIIIMGLVMLFWIYNSVIRPLNVLRIATMHIGNGNLDHPIFIRSSDEIGDLCRDFENMRLRLKDTIEARLQYEEDTRDMISNMAHDLRTPLTAIKGYTEGIIDGVADTEVKRNKYLRTIYSKANDLSYLVDELSLFSKVEQDSLVYNFKSLNANSYFSDCIEELSLDLETKDFKINFYNDIDTSTYVLADPEQLKRVITNIVGNSVKYSDKEDGIINIHISDYSDKSKPESTSVYRVIEPDKNNQKQQFIQVTISDNGQGVSENDLPYIFDRFFRADASRNSSKPGSGLGLSIVSKIIQDHGGKIWAQSRPGDGLTIGFTLTKPAQTF